MELVSRTVGSVASLISDLLYSFTDMFLTKPIEATISYLEETELKTLDGEMRTVKAKTIWAKSGAVIMAEASALSSLKTQLDELGVPLVAVVKENVGEEVKNFRPYFNGDIYLDEKRQFYGPRVRKMGASGFLRAGVWKNFYRAFRNGFLGNVYGEGFVMGGVFVIGAGSQGILLEHREMEFGDKVDLRLVANAVLNIQTDPTPVPEN